jgi:hypothetical protein
MTHTKGPWHLAGTGEMVCGGDNAEKIICDWPSDKGTPENCANARLIAAAPDLLSALEAMVDAVDMGDDLDHALDCTDAERCALCQARAAIDKAKGAR